MIDNDDQDVDDDADDDNDDNADDVNVVDEDDNNKYSKFSNNNAKDIYVKNILSTDGYSEDHIKFTWENDLTNGMSFVPSSTKMLPQYNLVGLSLSKTFNKYVVGEWKTTFIFNRPKSYSRYWTGVTNTPATVFEFAFIT